MRVIRIPMNEKLKGADALQMSAWCKDRGLTFGKDYDYCLMTGKQEVHFRFFNEYESMGSMFSLAWMK